MTTKTTRPLVPGQGLPGTTAKPPKRCKALNRAPGVRPSSGAAMSASTGEPEFPRMPASSEAAAPEDGRIPARSLAGTGIVRHIRAFTLIELVVVIALFALLATLLVPASAHTRPNSQAIQCLNNLRQMANAWQTYAEDNGGRIVSAYPNYGGFAGTWCAGNAESGGGSASYTYGGADPMGIQKGCSGITLSRLVSIIAPPIIVLPTVAASHHNSSGSRFCGAFR
jgi:prepilin-type N-terminal cleavage/methylation domain-containing protein